MRKTIYLLVAFLAFVVQSSFGHSKQDCYPGNAVPIPARPGPEPAQPGPTSTSGEAEGVVSNIELEKHGALTNLGGAKIEIEFDAQITGLNTSAGNGTSTGRAKVRIKWNNPSLGETEFASGCVQEISTHKPVITLGGDTPDAEVEYEGSVEDFPGYPGTVKAAVLSVVGKNDPDHPGKVELDFTIELGYTCFENVYTGGDGDIELGKVALANLDSEDFHINSMGDHGRWSFPDPNTNSSSCELASLTDAAALSARLTADNSLMNSVGSFELSRLAIIPKRIELNSKLT